MGTMTTTRITIAGDGTSAPDLVGLYLSTVMANGKPTPNSNAALVTTSYTSIMPAHLPNPAIWSQPLWMHIMSAAIKLVMLPILGCTNLTPHIPPHQVLAIQLISPFNAGTDTLWYNVQPHAHRGTLQSALLSKLQILLVSDTAIHSNGTGSNLCLGHLCWG